MSRLREVRTGPLPHPASHSGYDLWEAGWGCGPVPPFRLEA